MIAILGRVGDKIGKVIASTHSPYNLIIYFVAIVLLSSCIGKNEVEVNLKNPKKSTQKESLNITISNIQVVNHQIVITGTNLTSVSNFNIKESGAITNLQIESRTSTTIVANTLSNVTFTVGKILDFVFSNAQAASTFTVNFALCDSTLGGKGFNCAITPNDKEVLSYDAASGLWKPRAVNGISYQGSWDANDPDPIATTAGEYWIVSVARAPYQVGDWIVFNGSTFDQIDNSQMITSVFGRTGVVTALEGDYNLTKLSDVTITAPTTNQVLTYNGSSWVNAAATYTESDPMVSAFAKATLPTCGVGQVLKGDGTSLSCVALASTFSGTANRAMVTDGTGALAVSTITDTVLGYLSGATSNIQTQLDAKLSTSSFVNWSVAGVQTLEPTRLNLTTANRAVVTSAGGVPTASAVTTTELGYLSGVTSSVQTQLNSKLSSFTETDPGVSAFAKAALPTCNTGEVLKGNGTSLSCVTDNTGAGAYTGTINRVVLTDGATGALTVSNVTNTEAGYLSGVTSAIQAQLNAKQATITTASALTSGSIQTNLQNAVAINPYNTAAGNTGEVRFYELVANGTNYTGFKSPDLLGANIIYTMPGTAPNAGEVLSSTAGGVLSWIAIPSAPVTSVNGSTGAVTLTTTNIAEGTNLYHTDARVLGTQITAPTLTNAAIATNDTVQVSLGKLQAQISSKEGSLAAGTSAQYYRGDKSFQTLDTLAVPENTNLYFTDTRARTATVADAIADAVTNIAPSQNAVFDALALKLNSGSFIQWNTSGVQTIDPSRLNLGAPSASKAVVTDASGFVVASSATATELGYLSGVTSAIQTQLNSKLGTLGTGSITSTHILDGTIADADLAGSIAQSKITNLTSDLGNKQNTSTLAGDVRAIVLTGLSTATNAVIAATDSILVAFGKLQKQITDLNSTKLNTTGGTLTVGTIDGVPNPTTANQVANKAYVDSASSGSNPQAPSAYSPSCPTGYVSIPAIAYYPGASFCVMKYEAKTGSASVAATTAAAGTPVVSINRNDARTSCRLIGPGYDLISNAQWQTIARNIADQATNWSTGTVYSGELSRGHSDGSPNNSLAASTDNDGCNGTGQTCSDVLWDSQRRTHNLSNGEVIWDFASNVQEWVSDKNAVMAGANGYISTMSAGDKRQVRYGNDQFCAAPSSSPYCGMGYGSIDFPGGTVIRGGNWNHGGFAGVFFAYLDYAPTDTNTSLGFRCVFVP